MEFIGIRTRVIYYSKNGNKHEHIFTCETEDAEKAIDEALAKEENDVAQVILKPAYRAVSESSKKRKGELVTSVLENGIKITYREGDPGNSKISIA